MAGGWAQAILGAVSSPEPVSKPVDTSSLMNLGNLLQRKKQEARYFDLQKQQYKEPKRQAAIEALHAALANPDDKVALQAAIADAKQWGVEVSGVDALGAPQKMPQAEANEATPDAETPSDEDNDLGFSVVGEKPKPAAEPDYAEPPNAGKQVQARPVPKAISGFMAEQDQSPPEPPPSEAVSDSLPNPPPVKPRPGRQLTMPGQLPPPAGRDVVISVNGQPYSRFSVDELQGYRATQSVLVAHVFQPLIDNAGDDAAKKAAEVAQKSAVEAYNSGMSKQQAIEYGNRLWAQVAGQRFKRDWTLFPPGFKPKAPGGGGAPMSEKDQAKLAGAMNDDDRGWITTANQQFAIKYANQAASQAAMVGSLADAETPIAQNVGLINILHELSGAAVTNSEAARFFEGTDIPTRIKLVLRGIDGGDQPEAIKAAVKEIAHAMQVRSATLQNQAGQFVYQQVLTNYASPESDEQRIYHAKRMRSLYTGEALAPMKQGKKKGTLEPVNTANSAVDDITG